MKYIYMVFMFLFVTNFAFSQNRVYVKKTDGNTVITDVSDVEKIYFYNCGTKTVSYGGKIYNTIFIGGQCWLAENLDIGTFILKSTEHSNNGIIEKYCYDDNPANCITYGGLYMWDEAMNYSTVEGGQGICPPDWRIPTFTELEALKAAVGGDGNALKAIGQGSGAGAGTNTSGYSAKLGGSVSYLAHGKGWYDLGVVGHIWSSTVAAGGFSAYNMVLKADDSTINNTIDARGSGFCVRCIYDLQAQ